jgi:signal transduction histidine kinase
MPGKAQAAVDLPWLCPSTDSLIALANSPAGVPAASIADPALELFLFRFAQPATDPDPFGFAPGAFNSAFLPETAAAFLASTRAGILPDSSFVFSRVRGVAGRAAAIAMELAELTRLAPVQAAGSAARLAPLGWYAMAAVDPFDAADPLSDPRFATSASEVQAHVWGLDHSAIVRRLAARWRLPKWLGDTIAHLSMPFRLAKDLVANRELFAIVQLAAIEAESEDQTLGLAPLDCRNEVVDFLRLDKPAIDRAHSTAREHCKLEGSSLDPNPHRVPLVRNLLQLAGETRRRNGPALVKRLEGRIDELHHVIRDLGEQVGDRLRDAKLAGLAELAAGAGHEINNPLAIISSNAQRLLRGEVDPNRSESLQAIIRQANRIAGLLRDLMHFACPPAPDRHAFTACELVRAVHDEYRSLAAEREVRLEIVEPPSDWWLLADQKQLRRALGAVVQNAVEATPPEGWVRITCWEADSITIAIEDSGPGLTPEDAEHAFDPFYSGRKAGRGRGLGLSTAWRLAQQNRAELRFDATAAPVTRFLLTISRATGYELLSLKSA